ncbi:methylated-DNA--[protein]-cysteine S-methyltransferase [Maricaulis virginensis]|uniref:methylated-DNA--[protein]-cysteine S-methyltransferase n=1 Tax=Maricaulis virginensis TaxID=144022 RepID=A0A9W6IQV7_9PROT|nr:methylated-DNA--[protein]-cysteine S-methyltransferase [Maricaulis virginensis]GLK53679.1 6-O-methylguanine DNA methyltransferase [Maricaulis virginensis]
MMTAQNLDLDTACRDYRRIASALAWLGENWRDHPDLDAAARSTGLSPHHFQRLFTRWVGLSPKKYVGALAHGAAREALEDGASILDAAFDAGLSGPGRLHDLFIAHEAVTPGDAKRRGAGLSFVWGATPTPFGEAVLLIAPRGLSALAFAEPDIDTAFDDLHARFPAADYVRDDAEARAWAGRIFLGGGPGAPVPLALYGTPWQRQVWRALLEIPAGETTSYKSIAEQVRTPKAARAVGAAVGANPVAWLIPCHRVIAADGQLTGYHWGVERKRAMLAYEAAAR